LKRLSPGNLAALAGNDVNYPDNLVVVQFEIHRGIQSGPASGKLGT
jgi:hypothetical protein